jgi:hypothetical protein
MWCPSVSLSVWTNAWLAGQAAPDDVLDALSDWAPAHSVTAYDAVAAGRTGLPWPDMDGTGAMSLLQTIRKAIGPRDADMRSASPSIALALPVPGDVRGLPPGTQFQADALETGEAVLVRSADGTAIGLVPTFECAEDDTGYDAGYDESHDEGTISVTALLWSVYSLPGYPMSDQMDLGEAEFALRSAVRSAAEALDGLRLVAGAEDPRTLVDEVLQATRHHRIPDHAPDRAVRVLNTAAHVDAIVTVSSGVASIGTQSSSQAHIADAAMRPLASTVRAARSAAVNAILQSAWR